MHYNFDLDLKDGLKGESEVKQILLDPTIEVKTDFKTIKTGNIAVEYECRKKPSGLTISRAKWWIFNLVGLDTMIVISTAKLRKLVFSKPYRQVMGGDDNLSAMFLIPAKDFVNG